MDKLEHTAGGWAADIIEAAKATQQVQVVYDKNNQMFVALSNDQKLEKFDLEKYGAAPAAITQEIAVVEVLSFVDYWQRFSTDKSTIHARLKDKTFTAIIDAHAPGQPAWQRHRCSLICRTSTEWETWHGSDKKSMDQIKFAEFIESNAIDIVQPAAAEMIQVALTLQAKKKVNFNSGVRLDNGQVQLGYHEQVQGTAGPKGELQIPEKFTLALRIFQGGEKYSVECHLRYRINDGQLTFFYQIIRPERLLEDAFDLVKKQVKEGCKGATIFAVA